jgi:hypothetical protein
MKPEPHSECGSESGSSLSKRAEMKAVKRSQKKGDRDPDPYEVNRYESETLVCTLYYFVPIVVKMTKNLEKVHFFFIFLPLDPDPDSKPTKSLNPDPTRIRIHNPAFRRFTIRVPLPACVKF